MNFSNSFGMTRVNLVVKLILSFWLSSLRKGQIDNFMGAHNH